MAKNKGQKIFIWVIAIIMLVGTIGSSFLIILAQDNSARELAEQQKAFEEQKKKMLAEMEPLPGYKAAKFDADKVTELQKKDLKTGDGKTVTKDSTLKVNYFGWLSDGTIFDSTKRSGENTPTEFKLNETVTGWVEGLTGAKAGTVRELTIPAELAYGETGSSFIPPNSPLKFVVEVLEVK